MTFLSYLHRVCAATSLTSDEAEQAMNCILNAEASTPQIAAFLVALRMKRETSDELLGFARAMRARAVQVPVGSSGPLLDTCGTGGDGACTFNISTTVAFVAAGAGVRVAKHGNRSLSSQCGSADILEVLGVNVGLGAQRVGECIDACGIGFLFAPLIHPAMKQAQPARQELKMRTAFNLLGPLTNPAGATAQLAGAPSNGAAQLMAEVLAKLGVPRALVVHGRDGLDEISTTGPTECWEVRDGRVRSFRFHPKEVGLSCVSMEELRGGDRHRNAEITKRVLKGERGAAREIVLVNSAAALRTAGAVDTWEEGMAKAAESIDSGAALEKLGRLVEMSVGIQCGV